MSEAIKCLNYLTLSLFSEDEDIKYLNKLLLWGKKYLSKYIFENIINGKFEKILKIEDKISIKMQPLYICFIRNKLKSLQLLEKYGVQMVLDENFENISLCELGIINNVDNIFLEYLFGNKKDYNYSILELPIRRSDMNRVIFLLNYVKIEFSQLKEYLKIYDREDSKCKYHLPNDIKDEHKKNILNYYIEKKVKELSLVLINLPYELILEIIYFL